MRILYIIIPMPIHILPPEIASQIAAGEVIERPASVVKELIENALDAGARFITVRIEGAGRRLIEVTDDGSGIAAQELNLAVSRHATSKLNSAEDLFHIRTLGFRGEALASIASVARLTITSRQAADEFGASLHVEAGQAGPYQPAGYPVGTLVKVEDLFFNLPARLKFLKSGSTERNQIEGLVTRYSLAYPQVRFHLFEEGRQVLQTSGNGDFREVLGVLYGIEMARQMLEVLADYEDIQVTGFISPLSITRSNRREINFFVNGRPVQDIALATAMIQAYHTMLMVGRYPLGVLFLNLPPESVDVNVHPTKAEVRFREKDRVFGAVRRAVRLALMANSPLPDLDTTKIWAQVDGPHVDSPFERNAERYWQEGGEAGFGDAPQAGDSWVNQGAVLPSSTAAFQAGFGVRSFPLLRLVGQVAQTYLVAEGPDGLYLIDQHAAHERVLYERFKVLLDQVHVGQAKLPSQVLLQPVTVEIPSPGARRLAEQLPLIEKLGFQVEIFGPGVFLLRAIPALFVNAQPEALLRTFVEDFEEDETPFQGELEARMVARICKRAAVKAGKLLSPEEQQALLTDLEGCQAPRTCPHGRPTMIHLSVDLLERQFGRRGAR